MGSRIEMRTRCPASGLSVLVDPQQHRIRPEQPRFDIVFVHGFTGHPERTWSCAKVNTENDDDLVEPAPKKQKFRQSLDSFTSKKEGESTNTVFWPRDILPASIPEARILTYGYDTHIKHRFVSPLHSSIITGMATREQFLHLATPTDRCQARFPGTSNHCVRFCLGFSRSLRGRTERGSSKADDFHRS